MARSDTEWVADIRAAIADIRTDTAGVAFKTFSETPIIVRSVLYSLAIIGEAAKNLSPEFKANHPGIPWKAVAGMRDRIVHEYFRTNLRRIWDVVLDDLDPLQASLDVSPGKAPTDSRGES